MKFLQFKEFRSPTYSTLEGVVEFLRTELRKTWKELQVGLTKLSFLDNFESFSEEVTIGAGAELAVRNQFRDGSIPTQRLVVKGGDGSQNIVDGTTAWDSNFVYLKNTGASSVTATVVFLK